MYGFTTTNIKIKMPMKIIKYNDLSNTNSIGNAIGTSLSIMRAFSAKKIRSYPYKKEKYFLNCV